MFTTEGECSQLKDSFMTPEDRVLPTIDLGADKIPNKMWYT
jgi:hypothetical protein